VDWKLTNILPKAGGTLDQDPVFMRDLRTISSLEGKIQEQERKKAEVMAKIKKNIKGGKP
jgi:uncharacterized protein YpuA (DUF1002 family)